MQVHETRSGGDVVRSAIGVLVPLAGVSASLTVLFLGMRSVMEIGGACASGGPFVPVRPCPEGVPALIVGGIWAGLILAFVYVWQAVRHHVPSLVSLLWPALFLSLGWNFLEFGLDPPGGGGAEWGWLICAIVFFLMGGVPLVIALPWLWRSARGKGEHPASGSVRSSLTPPGVGFATTRLRRPATPADDVVTALERLDALHRSGSLDEEQYEAAKDQILGTDGAP
jgi:putative oligomerization/nucleic acid binding protein